MADLPSDFWSGWIIVLTVVSLLGLAWLVFSVYFSPTSAEEADTPVWDETLREGSNPAPLWWFWLILATMIVSVVYLMLYPGLGSFSGVLKWTQGGRLDASAEAYQEDFEDIRRLVLAAPLETLHEDERVMASARRIFDQNCVACHGPTGEGQAATFPNLMDDDWQWGGDADRLEATIRAGRQAVMPGLAVLLDEASISQISQHVLAMQEGNPIVAGSDGQTLYTTYCSACHGADGGGNQLLGAPNIADDITVYGATEPAIAETIALGRSGIMPPFAGRLDDVQIHMLVAWLTREPAPAPR
jgi:cytochrome c oxidase cbb3-type subunit III